MKKYNFPKDLEALKSRAGKILSPISPATNKTKADPKFLFNARRTQAGRLLPRYYLCYFLLVDLMGYRDLGQFEKISWSVPVDYKGNAFLIEHRKMGLGVFVSDLEKHEKDAAVIVEKIKRAVKIAEPYFEWKASEIAKKSKLNVVNHGTRLFNKYKFFLDLYKKTKDDADKKEGEILRVKKGVMTLSSFPAWELNRNAEWIALSVLDSFFSWTEHVFIHISILKGKIKTGEDVANLADKQWQDKFKSAISIENKKAKYFYDSFIEIRRQLRNHITHGSFGKKGQAFSFHSSVGAVPLLLPHQKGKSRFSFTQSLSFNELQVIELIEEFIEFLWSKERKPAKIYIESGLPLILTMVEDGQYLNAMKSANMMELLVEYLSREVDDAANMDW